MSKDENQFKFNNFAPLIQKLQSNKHAHYLVERLMVPKANQGTLVFWEGYGVIMTSKQTNKQTPTLIYTFQVEQMLVCLPNIQQTSCSTINISFHGNLLMAHPFTRHNQLILGMVNQTIFFSKESNHACIDAR